MKIKHTLDRQLFVHDGQNPFSGAYTNAIYARRQANGTFTVWVKAWGISATTEDCWHEDIASPAQFIAACQDCLEFVEFGDAGAVEVIRSGFAALCELDKEFSDALRTELLASFSEDCAEPQTNVQESGTSSEDKVRRLTNEEAREKYGSSVVFISNPHPKPSGEEGADPL
jgi:hypothetical protein